jgi:hypothetical protein
MKARASIHPVRANRSSRLSEAGANVIDIRSHENMHSIETLILDRVRELSAAISVAADRERAAASAESTIPFSIRMTLQQLVDVANSADLRAAMLPDVSKVQALHAIATELRTAAGRLLTEWS